MQHEILNEILEVSGLSLEELAGVASEFKVWAQGKSTGGWEAEVALCEREKVQKLWNKMYLTPLVRYGILWRTISEKDLLS